MKTPKPKLLDKKGWLRFDSIGIEAKDGEEVVARFYLGTTFVTKIPLHGGRWAPDLQITLSGFKGKMEIRKL